MAWISCILVVFSFGGDTAFTGSIPTYASTPRRVTGAASFVFLSDTQSPIWFEKIWLKSDRNEEVPGLIIGNIAHDSTVVAVFHLGDFTALGALSSYWKDFDREAAFLRDSGIPIYPAFGNHEYMPIAWRGRSNLTARFPFMDTPWYCRRVENVAIVILNSNFDQMTGRDEDNQQQWYTTELSELDQDSTVAVIMVACHHPPYTNSRIVGPSREVQRLFLPAFFRAQKTRVFLSGHAHAFEHFHVSGKEFLVIGGGGGLLHPLLQGDKQRRPDVYPHEDSRSFFHYLRCSATDDSLSLQVIRLRSDHARFDTACTVYVGLH